MPGATLERLHSRWVLLAAVLLALISAGCARSAERWAADLGSDDPFVRAMAAIALSDIAPERASSVLPTLLETVDRVDLELAAQARAALGRIAPHCLEDMVRELVLDEFMTVDRRAALIGALAVGGEAAAEALIAAVRGTGLQRAGGLAEVLAALGPPAVRPLAELLSSESDPALQVFAARTLGAIGPRASAAVPALREAAARSDPSVRVAAEEALSRISPGNPVRALER
jgi:HEAT repeat protein